MLVWLEENQGSCACVDVVTCSAAALQPLQWHQSCAAPLSPSFAAKSLGDSLTRVDRGKGRFCLWNFLQKQGILFSHFQSCSYSTQRESAMEWIKRTFARFNVLPRLLR